MLLETCREPVEMLVELTREFIRMYGEKKREKNILDFTDMEHFALEILIQRVHAAEENGENDGNWTGESKYIYHMSPAARELSLKYDEVMVDEYQDTNTAQFELIHLLAGKYRNLCVVGDDDQSIYKFRGANISNILDFEKVFPEAEVIKLEQNYRSTQTILDAANAVIRNNVERKEKALWTEKGEGDQIHFRQFDTAYEEAEFIAGENRKEEKKRESGIQGLRGSLPYQRTIPYSGRTFIMEGILRCGGGVNFYSRRETQGHAGIS